MYFRIVRGDKIPIEAQDTIAKIVCPAKNDLKMIQNSEPKKQNLRSRDVCLFRRNKEYLRLETRTRKKTER